MIVDAPASGHGLAMLTAPSTFGEIARVGPIRRQAFKVRDMLADPRRTGYVAVALPEEMPVNETLELGDAAARRGRPRARRDRRQRRLPGALQRQGGRGAARGGRERARARGAARRCAPALAEHERARDAALPPAPAQARGRARRCTRCPFLFDAEVGLEEYGDAAAKLGRDLG